MEALPLIDEAYLSRPFDVIITDCLMDTLDGMDLASVVRSKVAR